MFFDIFSMLCDKKGVSRYAAAKAIGKNRSAVAKWKTGSIPNGSTLALLAEYFGVTTDYLLGATDDAYLAWAEYKYNDLSIALINESDSGRRFELMSELDGLRETISDLKYQAEISNGQKNKPTGQADGLEALLENERVLLHGFRGMTESDQQFMLDFVKIKGRQNDAD